MSFRRSPSGIFVPQGFSAIPNINEKWPLTGPYLFYKSEDAVGGSSGWTPVGVGGAFDDNTGHLPNTGLAGSDFDAEFIQRSRNFSGYGPYYDGYATNFLDGTEDLLLAMGGSLEDSGPFVYFTATYNWPDDPTLIDPNDGELRDDFRAYIEFYPTFADGVYFGILDHRFEYRLHRPSTPYYRLRCGSVIPYAKLDGDFLADNITQWDIIIHQPDGVYEFSDKLIGTYMDIGNNSCDNFLKGVWMTEEEYFKFGFTPNLCEQEGMGLGDAAFNNRQSNINFGFGAKGVAASNPYYNDSSDFFGVGMYIDTHVSIGSLPSVGSPNIMRAMGLWRGMPSMDDLEDIATMMGASVA